MAPISIWKHSLHCEMMKIDSVLESVLLLDQIDQINLIMLLCPFTHGIFAKNKKIWGLEGTSELNS